MPEHGPSPFAAWEGFYVIIGTSAAALTGLQFVVIALLVEGRVRSSMQEVIAAFSTPTIVHFGLPDDRTTTGLSPRCASTAPTRERDTAAKLRSRIDAGPKG